METAIRTNVYFLQACQGGPVKIGHSQNVERRLAEIQPGHPFKLQVARLFENVDPAFEAWLHRRFSDLRLHGEWFEEEVMSATDTEDVRGLFESGHPPWCAEAPSTVHVDEAGRKSGYSMRFESYGSIDRTVGRAGSSGRIGIPKAWVGKKVMIVLQEPIGEVDPGA